jgi:cytochrome c551/c552/cytochrome b subunit of formate dehydrogenase
MKIFALAAVLAVLLPAGANAQSADALLQSKGCLGCHAVDKRVVGPAFQEVAARYKGDRAAPAKLASVLKEGKGHPMKVDASDAELKTLVQFVLAQGGDKPAPAAVKAPVNAPAPTALLESKGCLNCHAVDKRVVGPAFQEVAARYQGDGGAPAKLFGALKQGQGHPVRVDATDAELKTLVQFVLAQGTAKPAGKPAAAAPASMPLTKDVCLSCHGNEGFSTTRADGKPRPLHVTKDRFEYSVHGKRECVECHKDITEIPHRPGVAHRVSCITCHETLWKSLEENRSTEYKRLGVVADNIQRYLRSVHARPSSEDQSRTNATCYNCHDAHYVYPLGSTGRADWRLNIPNVCGKCHTKERELYATSVHGREVLKSGNPAAAVCSDCHTTHDIESPAKEATKLVIVKNCGNCHRESFRTYTQTYHGQVHKLGYTYTAKCYDCHGSHTIQRVSDPASRVHPDNRLQTCQTCHVRASAGFVTFQPHASTHDRERYPVMFWVSKFMIALIVSVFLFFWTHCLLWFYREYRDRKEGKTYPHITTASLPPRLQEAAKGKHYRRFGPVWRTAHLFFALSLMTLALTGMAAFYSETTWAANVVRWLGGPWVAALIHRVAAVTILSIFLAQIVYFLIRLAPRWRDFDWFSHRSLVPGPQDVRDIIAMFRWFFGKGPRPVFGRWSYWERFDYWAPFWGLAVVGGSGLMLWFKEATAAVWPGWMFNVATLAHGEEAFLAICFLFTVHFFNNHFRPDKLPPPDIVMFTGTMSLEDFAREHTVEYRELVASGEIEKHLVDVPSRAMTLGSRILGLCLLAVGLTILTLVLIGFIGQAG